MNKELIMVFLPSFSAMLFALGGTQISDQIKGWKAWRRFILPIVYFLFCLSTTIYQALAVALLAAIVYSLPYGDKIKKYRFFILLLYGAISIPIGISLWNALTIIAVVILFKLSNFKLTERLFTWKICEAFIGFLVGIQIAYVLMNLGLVWIK